MTEQLWGLWNENSQYWLALKKHRFDIKTFPAESLAAAYLQNWKTSQVNVEVPAALFQVCLIGADGMPIREIGDEERQERLAQIRERIGRATPGPWEWDWQLQRMYTPPGYLFNVIEFHMERSDAAKFADDPNYDMDFIAHAREDIAWLLDLLNGVPQGDGE